jgi:hypothetical protein
MELLSYFKTKSIFVSRHQNTGLNKNSVIANKSLESVTKLKYFGTTVTDQNYIHEEIKSSLILRECLLSFSSQSLFSHLLTKILSIQIHITRTTEMTNKR